MSNDKNTFGGGNRNSLYVPMSDVEQEVIARLIETQDLRVHLVGWGVINNPKVIQGDHRVSLAFRVDFDRPEPPGVSVPYFDLELRTGSGILLFKDRKSTQYGGKPLTVAAGVFFDMVWDIAIHHFDPNLVKMIKPGAIGLTSRLQDRDTKVISFQGNMRLDAEQQRLLRILRVGEAMVRQDDKQKAAKAVAKGIKRIVKADGS